MPQKETYWANFKSTFYIPDGEKLGLSLHNFDL